MGEGDVDSRVKRVRAEWWIDSDGLSPMPLPVELKSSHKHDECIAMLSARVLFAGASSSLHHRLTEYAV